MVVKRQRRQVRLDLSPAMSSPSHLAGPIPVRSVQPSATGTQRRKANPERKETSDSVEGGLYIISVAARLLEMHPQTLRKYERVGLVIPPRTGGMLRLYSSEDIARLRLIKHLVDDLGLNLAGVEFVLDMLSRLHQVRERVTALEEARQLKEMAGRELEAMLAILITAFDQVAEE
ncbi:MAG: MerR family transcriptional regulator [Dehalococcoidia bacterium]|nr:MerR family transcriptional regulator [Dehalococcoidia bacterium]